MDNPSVVPLVAQHESWVSLDPIQGCPADCSYCFLGPMTLAGRKPQVLSSPEEVYRQLHDYPFFDKSQISSDIHTRTLPICVGNYTDMGLTPHNRDYLLTLLREHRRRLPDAPVCVATKAVLDEDFLRCVDDIGVTVFIFVSLAFLPARFEQGTPPYTERLKNFERAAELTNVRCIHFWRPIMSINVPDRAAVEEQIRLLQRAGASVSVVTGLKFGDTLARRFVEHDENPLHAYFRAHVNDCLLQAEIFEPAIRDMIFDVARQDAYPVYLHTSCALSYLLQQPDYNGTFRQLHLETKCLASHCPQAQRQRCFSFKQAFERPSGEMLDQIAQYLGLPSSSVSYLPEPEIVFVEHELTQEQQTFLTHATRFPVRGRRLLSTIEWVGSINR